MTTLLPLSNMFLNAAATKIAPEGGRLGAEMIAEATVMSGLQTGVFCTLILGSDVIYLVAKPANETEVH